jgi:hypothetical protein
VFTARYGLHVDINASYFGFHDTRRYSGPSVSGHYVARSETFFATRSQPPDIL